MAQLIADLDTGAIRPARTGLDLLDDVVAEHKPLAVLALFSGGHDSLVNTHLTAQHPAFTAALHINTGIGIDETRVFVRETCERFGWPLIEASAPDGMYESMALSRGMPGGPKHHGIMYHRLKAQSLRRAMSVLRAKRRGLFVLSTGIRQGESTRRMLLHAGPSRRDAAGLWLNPILYMTASDVNDYIAQHGLQRNPVVDKLHRSGECLCGALADPNELKEIEFWYPEVGQRIRNLERACFEKGLPWQWGSKRAPVADARQSFMPMCQSCELRWEGVNNMAETIVERVCPACNLVQFYALEYEKPDYSIGVRGGWSGWLVPLEDQEGLVTGYIFEERCHCPFTDEERETAGYAVAKDYGPGDEPYNV